MSQSETSQTEITSISPKSHPPFPAEARSTVVEDPKQKKLMLGSLSLLLLTLSIVLWHERDFWFPDTQETEFDQPTASVSVAKSTAQPAEPAAPNIVPAKKTKHQVEAQAKPTVPPAPSGPDATTTARTVLPPLEVEVVAGDSHLPIRPASSSVRLDL